MSPIAAIVWQPYPPEIPMAERQLCEVGCGRPGEMLRIDPMGTAYLMPRAGQTHVLCREDAGPAGLDEWLASAAPEKLGFFDRLILRISGHKNLIPPK